MFGSIRRRAFLTLATAMLAGCREIKDGGNSRQPTRSVSSPSANPAIGDVDQVGSLQLTSPVFADGGSIPEKYGRRERNINPPLSIDGVPPGTRSLTLIVDDPDAIEPAGHVWLHWLVWNIPPKRTEIPSDWNVSDAIEGTNDFGETGYGGPAPPDGEHSYRFKLYALDMTLTVNRSASKRVVGAAMKSHRLAQTQRTGMYEP